jgi:hypothetical protein
MPVITLRSPVSFIFGCLLIAATNAPASASAMNLRNARVEAQSFAELDGWKDDDQAAAFSAFMKSCGAILNAGKAARSARPFLGALFNVCGRAASAGQLDRDHARAFFEDNFKPVRVMPAGQTEGFFTGYYETEVDGSRFPSDEYTIPIYAAPAETVKKRQSKVFADLDRTRIEDGALAGKSLEICYIKNPVDAFFAQIQGSTRVKLDNGKLLRLNYIASNGQPYTPVGKKCRWTRSAISWRPIRKKVKSCATRTVHLYSSRKHHWARKMSASARKACRSRPDARSRSTGASTFMARRSGLMPICRSKARSPKPSFAVCCLRKIPAPRLSVPRAPTFISDTARKSATSQAVSSSTGNSSCWYRRVWL